MHITIDISISSRKIHFGRSMIRYFFNILLKYYIRQKQINLQTRDSKTFFHVSRRWILKNRKFIP